MDEKEVKENLVSLGLDPEKHLAVTLEALANLGTAMSDVSFDTDADRIRTLTALEHLFFELSPTLFETEGDHCKALSLIALMSTELLDQQTK